MKALGSIITTAPRQPTVDEIYCCLFDYYDHWDDIDPRLREHHHPLSHAANVFAHDLVNLSAYAQEVLHWLQPQNLRSASSVVVVGALAEAFITSARSTCDGLSVALSYTASEKRGQAPSGSLRALLDWAEKNPPRVSVCARPAWKTTLTGFGSCVRFVTILSTGVPLQQLPVTAGSSICGSTRLAAGSLGSPSFRCLRALRRVYLI